MFWLRGDLCFLQQAFKVFNIAGVSNRVQAYLRGIGYQYRACRYAGRFELAAQHRDSDPKVAANCLQGAIRPEVRDQGLSRMGAGLIEGQVRQQGGGLLGSDGWLYGTTPLGGLYNDGIAYKQTTTP